MLGFGLGVTDLVVQRPGGTPLPALDLNFLAGALPSGVTFTRASSGTYTDSAGVLQTAAINAPRFDYAITASTTNLLTYSNGFTNAAWLKGCSNATTIPALTPAYAAGPDGTMSATRVVLTPPGDAEWALLRVNPITLPAAFHTASVWLKAASAGQVGKKVNLGMFNGSVFPAVVQATLTADWQRVVAVGAVHAAAGSTNEFFIGKHRSGNPNGLTNAEVATDFLVYGAQLEQSASVGTYVPTSGIPARIGGSTTNLALRSGDFSVSSAWAAGTGGAATVTTGPAGAPGGTNWWTLDDANTGATLGRVQTVAITSGTGAYTASLWLKAGTSSVASVRFAASGGTAVIGEGVIDLATGATQWRTSTTGTSLGAVAGPDGSWRMAVTITDNGSGNTSLLMEVRPAFAATYSPTLANAAIGTVLASGAQIETGSTLGPYVATTTAAATAHATEARGLLIEESRANLAPGQMSSTTYWTTLNTSTPAGATAPDGSTSAVTLTEIGTNGTTNYGANLASGSIPTIAAGPVTASIFVKAGTAPFFRLIVSDATTPTIGAQIYFSFATGAITLTGSQAGSPTAISSSVQAFPNGWYRLTLTVTLGAATTATMLLRLTSASGTSTDIGGNTALVWGPQLEVGSFATSYVPTTTASVTRAAESASMTTIAPWFNATEGTVLIEDDLPNQTRNPVVSVPFGFSDTSFNNSLYLSHGTSTDTLSVMSGGVQQAAVSAGAAMDGPRKVAAVYRANDFAACRNGGTVGTDTAGTVPALTQARIGAASWGSGGNQINGYVRRVRYFRSRLPNADLQNLSR